MSNGNALSTSQIERIHQALDAIIGVINSSSSSKQKIMLEVFENRMTALSKTLDAISEIHEASLNDGTRVTVAPDGTIVLASDVPKNG